MRDRGAWRRLADPVAVATLLLVAGSWHLAAAWTQSGFTWFYFVNEHLLRFLGRRIPDDYHHGPFWFYLPRVLLMLVPWTPFLLLARPHTGAESPRRAIVRFCQVAALVPFTFFSLSQGKADYYMLVGAPPLILWLAFEIESRLHAGDRPLSLCWGVSVASMTGLVVAVPNLVGDTSARAPLAAVVALVLVALGALAARWFGELRSVRARELALLAVALLAVPVLMLVFRVEAVRAVRDSSWEIARIILAQSKPSREVFIYRDFEDKFSTLPFYLGRTVPIIDSASRDLMFGCARDAGVQCLTSAQFRLARTRVPVAVVVQAKRANEFLAMAGSSGWQVQRAGDKMVFFDAR